jgi:KaiC/GvpD/RAD55 family RecA-like ATPase/transcriptional regulator with XRE-family HTH domain
MSTQPSDAHVSPNAFRDALRDALKSRHLKQKELADALGRNPSTVSFWLSGRQKPSISERETIRRLAAFLDIPTGQVVDLIEGPATVHGARRVETEADFEAELGWLAAEEAEVSVPSVTGALRRARAAGYEVQGEDVDAFRTWLTAAITHLRDAPTGPTIPAEGVDARHRNVEALFARPVRDTLRQNIRELNALFESQDHRIPRDEFIRLLGRGLPDDLAGHLADRAMGLDSARPGRPTPRLVEPDGDDVLARWTLTPDFLINSVGGFSSGLWGLDMLLDGGLLPQVGGGPVVLLKGKHGRGKSSVALEIAASLADQSHLVVYLSTEEQTSAILERLSYIGYHARERAGERAFRVEYADPRMGEHRTFHVSTSSFVDALDLEQQLENPPVLRSGLLYVVSVPPPFAALADRSDDIVRAIDYVQDRHQLRHVTVLVDSLDAVTSTKDRQDLERLFVQQRKPRRLTIFVCNDDATLKDYLADIVIDLSVRQRGDDNTERTLEITKGRTQNHRRGSHAFTIRSEEGVTVWPSVPSYLALWAQRVRSTQEPKPIRWQVNGLDIDALLAGDLKQGSCSLLFGEPGTRKTPLALSFLAGALSADVRESDERGVLFVSFVEDAGRLLSVARTYSGQLSPMLGGRHFHRRVRVMFQPPEFFFPERIFHWLRKEISLHGRSLSRVVVSGLGTYMAQSPPVSQDSALIPGLQEMFRKRDISSLFVECRPTLRDGVDLRELFDVVLQTERQGRGDEVDLRVVRTEAGNASSHHARLGRTRNLDGTAGLSLDVC